MPDQAGSICCLTRAHVSSAGHARKGRGRLRVAFVTDRVTAKDGWGRYSDGLIRALVGLGVEPVLISAPGELGSYLEGIEHYPILPPPLGRRMMLIRSLLFRNRLVPFLSDCDLVHCLVEPYLPLIAGSIRSGQPLVATAHGTWSVAPFESVVSRWPHQWALGRVDLLLCQSAYTRDRLRSRIRLPNHRVIPGGVRSEDFDQAADVNVPDAVNQVPVVLSVGTVKPRKGYMFSLEAVAKARRKYPALQYVLVGGGASGQPGAALRSRASALDMSANVHLIGKVPDADLAAWYRRATAFMLLPVNLGVKFEGLGLVYLEAAAAGRPSIGTLNCGAQEAVVQGRTGLLVEQANASAAADALLQLLANPDLRESMGAAGKLHAAKFDWRQVGQRVLTEYRTLLGLVPKVSSSLAATGL
jgi:phosphatidylinositol alpha-1,6-mannosyltransferase